MQRYPEVLKIIDDRIIQIRDNEINSSNLEFSVYEKIRALKDFQRGNPNDLEIIHFIKLVIANIPQTFASVVAREENMSTDSSDCLNDKKYRSLIEELDYYSISLNQIVTDFSKINKLSSSKSETPLKKKAGAKPKPNSFQAKGLNKVLLSKLYYLEIKGLKNPCFINKEKSSSEELFIEFFLSSDFSDLIKENVIFQFGIETIYVAYIFYWLYEFEFIALPYNAVTKSNICKATTGKLIIGNDLSSSRDVHKALYKYNYSTKQLGTRRLDKESKPHEVIPIINNYLSNIFPLLKA